jgi:hypothetical protein
MKQSTNLIATTVLLLTLGRVHHGRFIYPDTESNRKALQDAADVINDKGLYAETENPHFSLSDTNASDRLNRTLRIEPSNVCGKFTNAIISQEDGLTCLRADFIPCGPMGHLVPATAPVFAMRSLAVMRAVDPKSAVITQDLNKIITWDLMPPQKDLMKVTTPIRTTEYTTVVVNDEPGAGGACHNYSITATQYNVGILDIKFQNGPIQEHGVNGVQMEDLMAVCIHRLQGFQSGPYACAANQLALDHLKAAMTSLNERTKDRKDRDVEGTSKQ